MGYKLVLVDDQAIARELYADFLKDLGHEVITYGSGQECYVNLLTDSPDIVVTDLMMPPDEWGGLWLIGQIRRNDRTLPIIVLSEKGTVRQATQAIRIGGNGFTTYVEKAQVDRELPVAIQEMLQVQRQQLGLVDAYARRLSAFPFWGRLSGKAQQALANGEYLYHTNAGTRGFDFSGSLSAYAKALEIELHDKVVPTLKQVSATQQTLLVRKNIPLHSYTGAVAPADIISWLKTPNMASYMGACGKAVAQSELQELADDLDFIRIKRNPRIHSEMDYSIVDLESVRSRLLGINCKSVLAQVQRIA